MRHNQLNTVAMKAFSRKLYKIFSVISGLSLIFNSIFPASVLPLLVTPAYAQEETPAPTDVPTPEPTITVPPTPTEEPTVTPTPVITETPTEIPTPTEDATPSPTPEELTPTPTEVAQPTETGPPAEEGQILDGASTTAPTPTAEITVSQPQTDTVSEHGTLQAMILSNTNAQTLDINFDSTQPSGSATLTTDKADYAPTDTVVIAGTEFTAGKSYTLIINSQDPPAITNEAQVTANANGDFIYSYQLDGTYRPNYSVTITNQSGQIIAETTFTDAKSLSINFAGTGGGSVAVTDSTDTSKNTTCTSNCSVSTGNNDIGTLTATANGSSSFISWSSQTSGITGCVGAVCNFSMSNAAQSVTVTFNTSGSPTPTPTPPPIGPVSIQSTQCMGDQPTAPNGLTCTANDIQIASVDNIHIVASGPDANNLTPTNNQECEYPGQYIQFTASWHVRSTATSRYNVGLWFANSGQTNALHGTCSASTLPNSPTPFFEDTDDQCGDIHSGSTGTVSPDITVIAQCNAAPGTNQLRLPYCSSWDNNEQAGNACNSPAGTVPGTPSKCSCDDSFSIPIIVPFEAQIEVIKDLVPSSDSGTFNLQVDGTNKANCVSDGGTSGQVTVGAGTSENPGDTHTVGETVTGCGTTDLSDYTSSISCVDRGLSTFDGGAALTQSGTGPLNVPVDEDDDIVCTITNSVNQGDLTVIKHVDGGTDPASAWTMHIKQSNVDSVTPFAGAESPGTTQSLLPGTYNVSELGGPIGYTISYSGDCDSQGNVTVTAGQTAICTLTNTRDTGTLQVLKNVDLNGDGDYIDPGETGATDWLWQAYGPVNQSGNTGDAAVTVPTGDYNLAETQKTDFHLESLSCTGGTLSTFTVAVTKDANVVCTFTNKRDTGTITVDKVTDPSGAADIFTINLNQGPAQTPTLIHSSTLTDQDTPDTYTVITGEYWLAELDKTGWDLTDATCTDGTASFDPRADGFTIPKDVHLTCTFTNTQRGSISGHKLEDGTQTPLEGWVIQLWKWVTSAFVNTGQTDTTDSNGFFSFENLVPDLYQLREVLQGGWTKITPSGDGIAVTLDPGESDENNDFVNFELGKITACKYNDLVGNGIYDAAVDQPLANIDIKLSQGGNLIDTKATGGNGCVTFDGLTAGTYRVEEDYTDPDLNGYYSTNGITHYDVNITSGSDETRIFLNTLYRTISGTKYNDLNGNGSRDQGEPGLEGWTIYLYSGNPSTTTDANGNYQFTNLAADQYTIHEVLENGWTQTEPTTGYYDRDLHFIATSTSNDFGNQQLKPILTITKENNTGGANRSPGDSVLFTITVTATQSAAYNVHVTDLPAGGFVPRDGTYTANSSVRGDIFGLTGNPGYHSPGVWNLGDMQKDEKVTLTYLADIAGNEQPGLYYDLAWAAGCKTDSSCSDVLANAVIPGYIADNYVGTEVRILTDQQYGANVNVVGEVLGASTELPATGANTFWLYVAFGLISGGLTLGALGWFLRRKYA